MPGEVLLGSLRFGELTTLLPSARRLVIIPTAANGLPDRDEIVARYREQLLAQGWALDELDIEHASAADVEHRLARADGVFVSGGDPFHLLEVARRCGFADQVRTAVARGGCYVGASAGAMLAGPDLAAIVDVSPFAPAAGQDLAGLGLTDWTVLPHEQPDRRARHAAAQRRHGATHRLLAVTDDEVLDTGPPWRLIDQRHDRWLRAAEPGDADAVAGVLADAGRAAWEFLDGGRMAAFRPRADVWAGRIATADDDNLVVVADPTGVVGFVWVRPRADDLDVGVGEIAAYYTRPRLWGAGAGRRLMTYALDRLLAAGCTTAVLWTEERNARPLAIYRRQGWQLDGQVRERVFEQRRIRELRHRMPL